MEYCRCVVWQNFLQLDERVDQRLPRSSASWCLLVRRQRGQHQSFIDQSLCAKSLGQSSDYALSIHYLVHLIPTLYSYCPSVRMFIVQLSCSHDDNILGCHYDLYARSHTGVTCCLLEHALMDLDRANHTRTRRRLTLVFVVVMRRVMSAVTSGNRCSWCCRHDVGTRRGAARQVRTRTRGRERQSAR